MSFGHRGDDRLLTRAARKAVATQRSERGITLLEMLIVAALLALVAGLSVAPVSAGLETLKLRQASDEVVSLLALASDRADRKQQVVEIEVLPLAGAVLARTGDHSFLKRVDLPPGMKIAAILPEIPYADPTAVRRFLIYPGGSVPQVAIDILNSASGRLRRVSLDPLTGSARAEETMLASSSNGAAK